MHERALEHVKEGESFSHKSHIVKHWINTHPEIPSPPEMIFSITGRYRDCLSRQVGEALRIHYSQDNILNSKSEYRSNTITRLAIEEDAWERRERSRLEEEEDRLAKETVEQFKRDKTTGQDTPTSQTLEYETDEEEFASEEDCHQLMKYEPEPELAEDRIPISTRPSNAQQVTLGQSKRSPGVPLMNMSGVSQVQHEHPWLKVVREGEDESGVMVPEYETDEDEFDRGEGHSILPGGSRQDTTLAVPATPPAIVRRVGKMKRSDGQRQCQSNSGYPNSSLGYFSLWWGRMEREAVKDVVGKQEKLKESERYRQERRLRSMLDFGQKTDETGSSSNITITETEETENIASYGRLHSDQSLPNCLDDLRTDPTIFEGKGGEQTHIHSSMEPLASVGGYGVTVGETKVIV